MRELSHKLWAKAVALTLAVIVMMALIFSTVLSIACGYISSNLPLGDFFKRFAATENSREFGASDE